jgi:site-specific recombinase XerD
MGRRVSFVPDSPQYQWDAVVRTFIEFKEAVHCAPSTLSGYRHTLRLFHQRTNPDLNDPNGLRRAVVKFLKDYENPYSYNLHRAYLRAFFNWCIEEEIIKGKNPVKGTPYRTTSPRIRHLDDETLMALISAQDRRTYDGVRDYAIILVMLDCGIGPGEILQVLPRHFNARRGTISVSDRAAKSRIERTLSVSSTTVNAINKLISKRHPLWEGDVPIFCSRDGKRMNVTSWTHAFKKYVRRKALDDTITSYDLRHTFAIMFLRNGGNLFALKTIMGHQELKMTERYARFIGRDVKLEHEKASPVKYLMSKRV